MSASGKDLSDLTAQCIRCGFCLEACPTFVVTGREQDSPRGRIYLVRSAAEGKLAWEDARGNLDRCLGCRACEPACPSGVQYGAILELARDRLEKQRPNRPRRLFMEGVTRPSILRAQLKLGRLLPGKKMPASLAQLLSGGPPEVERPVAQSPATWPDLDEALLPPVRGEVYLLEGCAMRVLFPRVHQATRRLLRRVGFRVRESSAGCCGALHAHQGYLEEANRLVAGVAVAMPEDLPVVVNSAGCGSFLKEHGPLKNRALDASEFLLREGLISALESSPGLKVRLTYHDACHLAHGQGIKSAPRALLAAIPGAELVELEEADRCCGSAGIYNVLQPRLARQLVDRKWSHVEQSGAALVVMGNPGCQAWIAQKAREAGGRVRVAHTLEVLEESFNR